MHDKTTVPDFDPQWDLPPTPLRSAYFVCTTPRTGSNLLCFSLAKQGIGVPLEYLNLLGNGSTQDFYNRVTNDDFKSDIDAGLHPTEIGSKYIPQIVHHRTTPNGIFGMKVFAHHFTNMFGETDISVLTPMTGVAPKLIHLVRENLIELTVSFIMARNSQLWHSEMTPDKAKETVYTFKSFFETMMDLNAVQNKWLVILNRQPQHNVLRVTYKQLSDNYTDTMQRVNNFLNITDTEIPPPPIQRQSSDEKRHLIEQFTRDCRLNARQVRTALQKAKNKHR